MAAGNHDATIAAKMLDGVIQERRGYLADVRDFTTRTHQTCHNCVSESFGAEPNISADIDLFAGLPPDVCADGTAKLFNTRAEQLEIGDSANVVFAENCGFQHSPSITAGSKGNIPREQWYTALSGDRDPERPDYRATSRLIY